MCAVAHGGNSNFAKFVQSLYEIPDKLCIELDSLTSKKMGSFIFQRPQRLISAQEWGQMTRSLEPQELIQFLWHISHILKTESLVSVILCAQDFFGRDWA